MSIDSKNPFRALEALSLEDVDPEDWNKANGSSRNFTVEGTNLRHPLVWIDLEMTGTLRYPHLITSNPVKYPPPDPQHSSLPSFSPRFRSFKRPNSPNSLHCHRW